ncbi:conserved hypothetical protein [Microsporum canis CBS 113480]|uniref:RED-like N-terminal domain-containing protein n=1 Tax=Arthroderma otae (strain ATCC MYA-4605 / CBS 113480) TaxID=554155 RepID=C5G0V5_ARTOC|nr:conserved hypothetical protein [Microsporum canis CBS 113480]EEQ35758.1 conserved hypothetical protein [Microsporum canis CBS 113480]
MATQEAEQLHISKSKMNNEQFRRLLLDNTTTSPRQANSTSKKTSSGENATSTERGSALGSRMRSSIPMTPRAVSGVDFARQLAEHRRDVQGQPPPKKFKAATGPKGFKYARGYEDRASLRQSNEQKATDDREERVRGLEELLKLGKIDQPTFDKLRSEIGVGGDVSSTHLVKGLDWQLLKRVKAGEDVTTKSHDPEPSTADDEFERIVEEKEKHNVESIAIKEREKKRGTLAPLAQILKQLKASRQGALPQAEPSLGSKFKKIGSQGSNKKRWIETDANGRRKEILVITDSSGKTKKKTRWLDNAGEVNPYLLSVNKDAKPLGMEVPAEVLARMTSTKDVEADEDEDIFAGVGDDYNPLANAKEDEDSSSNEEGDKKKSPSVKEASPQADTETKLERKLSSSQRRDYFATGKSGQLGASDEQQPTDRSNPFVSDPTIRDALRKAATIGIHDPLSDDDTDGVANGSALKHRSFLEEARRREREDALDIDMGFGGSRFGDEEDEEVLDRGGSSHSKRKRGPKKKKGDKNNVSDVLRVLEGRGKT